MPQTLDITPSPRVLRMLGQIDFAPWQCLAELVDNSIDAFIDQNGSNAAIVSPRVIISLPSDGELKKGGGTLRLKDNGPGMDLGQLEDAVKAGYSGNDPVEKMGLFGMGFNIATARLGRRTEVWTTRQEMDEWIGVVIDFDELERSKTFSAPVLRREKTETELETQARGTEICISKLIPTYLLMLANPASYIFMKPSLVKRFFRAVGDGGMTEQKVLSAAYYNAVLNRFREISAELQSLAPRDMIDLQSFYYVTMKSKPSEKSNFQQLMQSYFDEGTVFQSASRGQAYAVESVDDDGCTVSRLDANEPVRVTWSIYESRVDQLPLVGKTAAVDTLNGTFAIRNTLLQGADILLYIDNETISQTGDLDHICRVFCERLRNLNTDSGKLYKPAMMAAVIEAISDGSLSDNRIIYDNVVPQFVERMERAGETVPPAKACMPFVHLRGDLFWMLCYHDVEQRVESGGDGAAAIRSKVRHARIQEPYWTMLQDEECRTRCLDVLNEILKVEEEAMPFSLEAFFQALEESGLVLGEQMPASISAALHAKSFLILTGLSGSGKTQLALAFSKWICADQMQSELIAVGADWTSNENLLGYPDALNPQHYQKPDNGALDLILRAQDNPELPHFLILDEMNLSHVERYFADFLSAMESGEAISLHDDTGEDWSGVPAKLKIPKNLFVIGTVNVDETTYMFSPKVLDRANVIEFRVSDIEMKSFLANPVKPDLDSIAGQGAAYAKAFVSAAKQKDFTLDEQEQVSAVLMKFFPELKEAGAEFGYRTAHEISRFVYFHKELSSKDWKLETAMDAAIMQKLLPKLHGSKKKLGPVLAALIRLCLKDGDWLKNDPVKEEDLTATNALYPVSLEKLARMRKRLAEHGFTSFAEA